VKYPDDEFATTRFILLPDSADIRHNITFRFTNELLVEIISHTTDNELRWTFEYDDVDPHRLYRAITGVKAPIGLMENQLYYTEEGMAFPDIAGLPVMRCVHRHTLIPGGGHSPQVSPHGSYTRKNYLGKDASVNTWQPDQYQMLHILLHDYQYGSIEQHLDTDGNNFGYGDPQI